jgi:hypothetical protein
LQNRLIEQGLTAQLGIPVNTVVPVSAEPPEVPEHVMLTFAFEAGQPTFTSALSVKEDS